MTAYLVIYELKNSGSGYSGLWSALRAFAGCTQIGPSCYGIESDESAEAVFQKLEPHLERYDFLFVVEMGKGLAGRGSEKASAWLQQHA
jgi:hypothetical protein